MDKHGKVDHSHVPHGYSFGRSTLLAADTLQEKEQQVAVARPAFIIGPTVPALFLARFVAREDFERALIVQECSSSLTYRIRRRRVKK